MRYVTEKMLADISSDLHQAWQAYFIAIRENSVSHETHLSGETVFTFRNGKQMTLCPRPETSER